MIDLYTWTTPNGRKVSILLEELGVPYNSISVNIGQDDQFKPEFLAIAPNNKIPAIVDHETGVQMMETGAIMLYLAEKYDRFLGSGNDRLKAIEWLMWQMGGLGPMAGQTHHFVKFNKGTSEYAGRSAIRTYHCFKSGNSFRSISCHSNRLIHGQHAISAIVYSPVMKSRPFRRSFNTR